MIKENDNGPHLKMLELTSEFSAEKCQDICEAMLQVAEQANDLDEATFWINVLKEIEEYPFVISEKRPHGIEECPECEGKKELVYSCCTGEVVNNESMICPICTEHLGEEPCYTCSGRGWMISEPEVQECVANPMPKDQNAGNQIG